VNPARRRMRTRWLRIGFALFAVLVATMLVRYARAVDWSAVGVALAAYDATTLVLVSALAALSYLTYGSYDLAARRYTGHTLSTLRVLGIGMTTYAFALSLGAVVGGAGFRFRMYARSGLRAGTISRIVAFSVATNWLGYAALAGVLFASGVLVPPPQWGLGLGMLRALGIAMLVIAAGYLVACSAWHGRSFHLRGHHFRLPSLALGTLQVLFAALDWSLMATILYLLLGASFDWPLVLGTLLLASVATALVHIPAGIGVMEAVFVAVLANGVPDPRILAALLAWRAVYYLAPLLLATAFYLAFEARGRKSSQVGSA
jgi:uncharacterized membrane protein YbhN (UPF0104 family)